MIKIILAIFITTHLFAYNDFDMDGVDDAIDACPNTPFSDLVYKDGCTKKSLESPHHFDIIVGLSFSELTYTTQEDSNNLNTSLELNYYYKDFSLQMGGSYYDSLSDDESGFNDSYINFYYKNSLTQKLLIKIGAGINLPSYDSTLKNNNLDYLICGYAHYTFDTFTLFTNSSYSFIEDENRDDIVYQNTFYFGAGLGYYLNSKTYTSVSINTNDSIYKGDEKINTLSLYANYSIDENYFTTLSYSYGLSQNASDNYVSFRIGYYF